MKIECPHCGVKGSADDSYHGLKVKCPKCTGVFIAVPPAFEPPPEDFVSIEPPAEESVDVSTQSLQAAEGETIKASESPSELVAAAVADDIDSEVEDVTDLLSADDTLVTEELSVAPSSQPVVEKEELLDWQDIVSEIDKEMAEGDIREKQGTGDPAELDDFFAAGAPVVADNDASPRLNEEPEPELVSEPAATAMETSLAAEEPPGIISEPLPVDLSATAEAEKSIPDAVEDQPYGMEKEQCWQCGKEDSVGVPFFAKDGRLYCSECLPAEKPEVDAAVVPPVLPPHEANGITDDAQQDRRYGFTIIGLIKEAWVKTKGAKGAIWAGSAVMYLALIVLIAGGAFILPSESSSLEGASIVGVVSNLLFQLITNGVSVIFSAGLIAIGIKKVAGGEVGWKMVFDGFPVAGNLIVAAILQTLLVGIGFLLLILPGIYLSVGYAMTIPLIVDRKMSAWQAMETSRKAIHKEWWKIFGLFIVVGCIFLLSFLPLGLGLIWTWPMFVILGGVVYRSLLGIEKRNEAGE